MVTQHFAGSTTVGGPLKKSLIKRKKKKIEEKFEQTALDRQWPKTVLESGQADFVAPSMKIVGFH